MKTIRCNVFETNSSSEHVVTLFNESEIQDFKNYKSYYNTSEGGFINVDCWKKALKNFVDVKAIKDEWNDYPEILKEKLEDAEILKDVTEEQIEVAFNWFMDYLREDEDHGEAVHSNISDVQFSDYNENFTEGMIHFIEVMLDETWRCWTWDTWGAGYEESDIDQITTPHGDIVYALSYSGYGD